MSFRWRLVAGLWLLSLILGGVQIGLGYASFERGLAADQQSDLARLAAAVRAGIRVRSGRVELEADELELGGLLRGGSYRLERGGVVLAASPPLPEGAPQVSRQERLPEGLILTVSLDESEHQRVLASYLRRSLLVLPLTLVLALALSGLLVQLLMRPVTALTRASEAIGHQQFPEPLPVTTGRDELATLTRSFNQMSEAIRAALERERSFTRYASHELRTPLTSLDTQLEALERGVLSPEQVLPRLRAATARLEAILAGLLELTRAPERGRARVELGEIAQLTLEDFSAAERDRVTLELPQAPLLVETHPDLLRQALGNLLRNALRYSEGAVRVRLGAEPHAVRLAVRDAGPGVPEALLSRLGEPFVRARTDGPGLGLGLALVRHVMQALGGRLELRNLHPGFEAALVLPR